MSPDEIVKLIVTIATTLVASVGGASVIILGLASWLGKVWSDRIYIHSSAKYEKDIEEIKSRYSADLEYIRAEISERRDLLNSLQMALSSGYTSSHERILEAVQSLWDKIVEIREFTSSFHLIWNILLPRHYENTPISKFEKMLPSLTTAEFTERLQSLDKGIQNKRPFVGEKLWGLYSVYYVFALRLAWKVMEEKQKGKVYDWNKDIDGTPDTHLIETLHSALTDAELKGIIEKDPKCGVPQRLMSALEIKMLNEMNELIFGKRFVSISIEEQQRISGLLHPISNRVEIPPKKKRANTGST
jgi:hypothetical protein